jgi:hypothetical protein
MFESIRGQNPELDQLQADVARLEQEVYEASSRVAQLEADAASAHEDDILREAKARNDGKRVPSPKEPEIRAQLAGAARRLEVLQSQLSLKQSELSRYMGSNAQELGRLLAEAELAGAREVSELAAPLVKALDKYQQPALDARALRPYLGEPAQENSAGPQDTVFFLGPLRRENAFGPERIAGVPIGRAAAIVAEMVNLPSRHEQGDATIVGPTPEESDEGAA